MIELIKFCLQLTAIVSGVFTIVLATSPTIKSVTEWIVAILIFWIVNDVRKLVNRNKELVAKVEELTTPSTQIKLGTLGVGETIEFKLRLDERRGGIDMLAQGKVLSVELISFPERQVTNTGAYLYMYIPLSEEEMTYMDVYPSEMPCWQIKVENVRP